MFSAPEKDNIRNIRLLISAVRHSSCVTKMTDKEFRELCKGYDFSKGGEGDSPYDQDFVDELFGNRKKRGKRR